MKTFSSCSRIVSDWRTWQGRKSPQEDRLPNSESIVIYTVCTCLLILQRIQNCFNPNVLCCMRARTCACVACVCVHACVRVYVLHACVCVCCMHACVCMCCMRVCACMCVQACMCVLHACVCVCVCCMRVCVCKCNVCSFMC